MNVKENDLAIVVASDSEANIGIICKVGRYIGNFDGMKNVWHVTSVTRSFVFCSSTQPRRDVHMPDASLRPVSGLSDTESTDEQREITQPQDSDHVASGAKHLIPEETA